MRSLFRPSSGRVFPDLPADRFIAAQHDPKALLWVDLDLRNHNESLQILREIFGFHTLAVDDVLEEPHVPKVDDYGNYLFLVVHALELATGRFSVRTIELNCFLGFNYLITCHSESIPAVDSLWQQCAQDEKLMSQGAAMLLHTLLDRLAGDTMPRLAALERALDDLEAEFFRAADQKTLQLLFTLRRDALRLRRVLPLQRETLHLLAHSEFRCIPSAARPFFRNTYDHFVRVADTAEDIRELAGSAAQVYLSVASQRLNEFTKMLTMVATLFLPLLLIAGICSLSFEHMPELSWRVGSPLALLLMACVAAAILYWFRQRGWW